MSLDNIKYMENKKKVNRVLEKIFMEQYIEDLILSQEKLDIFFDEKYRKRIHLYRGGSLRTQYEELHEEYKSRISDITILNTDKDDMTLFKNSKDFESKAYIFRSVSDITLENIKNFYANYEDKLIKYMNDSMKKYVSYEKIINEHLGNIIELNNKRKNILKNPEKLSIMENVISYIRLEIKKVLDEYRMYYNNHKEYIEFYTKRAERDFDDIEKICPYSYFMKYEGETLISILKRSEHYDIFRRCLTTSYEYYCRCKCKNRSECGCECKCKYGCKCRRIKKLGFHYKEN